MKYVSRAVAGAALVVLSVPAVSFAQKPPKNPHWAVNFSATPSWKIASFLAEGLGDEGSPVDFRGSEFTIGFGRGSRRGGDWGVSFVRKPFKDGIIQTQNDRNCFTPFNQPEICGTSTETNSFRGVMLTGVEVHWFIPVATIKNRVQIGVNLAGGAANFKGTVHKVEDGLEVQFVPGPGGSGTNVLVPFHTEEDNPVGDELIKTFPLIKVEVQGALILSSAFKIKAGYGLNFPGNGFRVAAVYLIGG